MVTGVLEIFALCCLGKQQTLPIVKELDSPTFCASADLGRQKPAHKTFNKQPSSARRSAAWRHKINHKTKLAPDKMYAPRLVERIGIEPMTSGLQSRRSPS